MTEEEIRSQAQGMAIGFMLDDPEVGPMLRDLISGKIDDQTFQNRLRTSTWYRTTAPSARQWAADAARDPAKTHQAIAQHAAELADLGRQMGVTGVDYNTIASFSLMTGMNSAQERDFLASHVVFGTKHRTGGAQGVLDQVTGLVGEYAVPVTFAQRGAWARGLLNGDESEASIRGALAQRAMNLYHGNADLVDALKQGRSVKDYADPYLAMAANELEISPTAINLTDAKWSRALQTVNQEGKRVPMSLADWQTTIRTDPTYGYDHTTQAREQAAGFVQQALQEFGAVG